MTDYLENIMPDSLTGAVFAIEGIKDACVILNGPTGCKFYHSAVSDSRFIRGLSFDPVSFSEEFYFGQPRVPSTYLDGHDYVFGSGDKLSKILKSVAAKNFGLIAVINTPGAALIGDDLEGFLHKEIENIPCFAIENTGYSGSFSTGYQKAVTAALAAIKPCPRKIRKKTVNLLGINIYQKYFDNNYAALKALLGKCGIDVICAPSAGDDVKRLKGFTEAELNIVVYQEYGGELARVIEKDYGIPFAALSEGPPIGFDGTQAFIMEVCEALGAPPEGALIDLEKARARAYLYLARFSSLLGLPKGSLFSIKAEASVCFALTKWLCGYLGMIPAAISVSGNDDRVFTKKLMDYLAGVRHSEALAAPLMETKTQMLLADGSTIASMRLRGGRFCGVEISLPTLGYLDITKKYFLGEEGALYLLEQIINGLRFV